ncbi:UPF0365 protein [Frankliniella fusca]|uniref:UPF0365 protein n=1 Tax=Frankliniella fusca TaxID=407009 RepID=A0AAE1HSN3_9NEOP|nr:UPF0365 protein [Frankliniella fusca]
MPKLPAKVFYWPQDMKTASVPFPHIITDVTLQEKGDNMILTEVSARLAVVPRALAAAGPGRSALRDAALRSVWDDMIKILLAILDFITKLIDPTPLGDHAWHFNGAVAGNLSLMGLQARHLQDLKVQHYDINLSTMCAGIDLLLPKLSLQAKYDVDLNVNLEEGSNSDFRFFGNGQAKVDMWNVQLYTDLCVTLNPINANVANMKLSIKKDRVDLQNLFSDPPLSKAISKVATDVLPSMVQEFQKEITEFIMTYLNKLIDEKMPHSSTNQV